MSSLRIPGLALIIGHTMDGFCHIWILVSDPDDGKVNLSPSLRTIIIPVLSEANNPVKEFLLLFLIASKENQKGTLKQK
jgi:hypothetical protein